MAWPTKGYSELAQLVGNHPGLAIFRRFATLNAQNLLYLQSELAILEDDLKDLVIADSTSDNEKRKRYQFRIRELKEASVESEDGAQWQKVQEIREKLKEYSTLWLWQLSQRIKVNLVRCCFAATCSVIQAPRGE